ncbi:cytochrome P450, partial [Wolfiporia cocos MD-104 SS10]
LPPGPAPLPIIGNTLHIPQVHPWLTYSKWAKTYGDLIHLDVLGQSIIVINSSEIANDLLDKRSSKYSDRPRLATGYNQVFVMRGYDNEWRRRRKIVTQGFSQAKIPNYFSLQELAACKLTLDLIDDPTHFVNHVKFHTISITARVTYGYDVKDLSNPLVAKILKGVENLSEASVPGTWAVDFLPQRESTRMPHGISIIGANKARYDSLQALHSSQTYPLSKLNNTAITPSLCSKVLTESENALSKEGESDLAWSANMIMGGGTETNISTTLTFILAMVLYPEAQKRAQAEIDSVIGPNHLPTIRDKPSLPYVRSVIAEVFRWNPAAPLAAVHSMSEEDVYNGYYLPKGSMILPNVWHMTHDPEQYSEPMEFKPERYQYDDAQMTKVMSLGFGFGRRACPGSHFAESTFFAMVSTILACCNIMPAKDEHGNVIIPEIEYSTGMIVFPKEFKCNIEPRSSRVQ